MSTLSPVRRSLALLPILLITAFLLAAVWNLTSHVASPVPVSAQATNLIVNGNFEAAGISPWVIDGNVEHGPWNVDHGKVVTISGATSNLYQVVTPDSTGAYEFSFECRRASSGSPHLLFSIDTADSDTMRIDGKCTNKSYWHQDLTEKLLLLEAGTPYTFTISTQDNTRYHLDNVSLVKVSNITDLDTGLIENGDFIGSDGWTYLDGAQFTLEAGAFITQMGAVNLPTGSSILQSVTPETTADYEVRYACNADGTPNDSLFNLQIEDEDTILLNVHSKCDNTANKGWHFITHTVNLAQNVPYTVTVFTSFGYIADIIAIVDPDANPGPGPNPDPTYAAIPGQCPFASDAMHNYPEGVDSLTGSFSNQSTDLSQPAAGGYMQFIRYYTSGSINQYASNSQLRHAIPGGWVHNYEMQLRSEDTQIPDTIELQTPAGDLLPFFISGDNYIPYSGVTAELSYNDTTDEYELTSFDQNTYYFDSNGRLLRQVDADGNTIFFSYDTNGRLYRATQDSEYLEYDYDAQDRLIAVSDQTGRTVELGYDQDQLQAVTNTLEVATTYVYSGSTQFLTQINDPTGRALRAVDYDSHGRATDVRDGVGNALLHIDFGLETIDGSIENTVTQRGVPMVHSYDERGTLVDVTYTCSGTAGCQDGYTKTYDESFKVSHITDANGHTTDMTWDSGSCSNLTEITDGLEHNTTMQYNSLNSLIQVTNAREHTTGFGYDNTSYPTFRTSMTDAQNHTTSYVPTTAGVDGPVGGLLKLITDANGHSTYYEYNEIGQITTATMAYGTADALTTLYSYDAVGRLQVTTQVGNEENRRNLNVYDVGDRLIATIANWTGTDPDAWQSTCLIPATAADKNICTRYAYDDAGRPISSTNALGQTTLTFYDNAGRAYLTVSSYDGTTYTNPLPDLCDSGYGTQVTTDALGTHNLCSRTEYDSYGRVVTTTDSLGRQDVTVYDAMGRVAGTIVNQVNVTSLNACSFPPAAADQDICTLYTYDDAGNNTLVTDTLGRVTRSFYDDLNRVAGTIVNWDGSTTLASCTNLPAERDDNICTQYAYDEVGNTIIVTDTLGRMTRSFYDELNRVAVTVANWNPATLTEVSDCVLAADNDSEENICTVYGYDPAGNAITTTNALAQAALTVYDAANRPVVQVANWDGQTTILANGTGCATAADAVQNVCSRTIYDSLGRQASTINPLGHVTTYGYDGLGRLITTTQYLNQSPIYTLQAYDALGNRFSSTDANGHTTSYVYDSLNRLQTSISAEGVAFTQTYNTVGWVLTTTNGLGHTTTTSYDQLGRRTAVTDAEGNTTTYEYDALGNQVAMIDAEGVRTGYIYDSLNRLVRVIENQIFVAGPTADPHNISTWYAYDALGNRTVITNARGFTSTFTTYDALSRPILVEDALGNQTETTYNALGYPTSVTDGNGAVTQYTYDALNRLRHSYYVADNETVSTNYDMAGNRLTLADGNGVTGYIYDDLSRLITVTDPFTGTVGYEYDDVGNRTVTFYPDGKEVLYIYDDDNRLQQVNKWGSGVTTYTYDAAGQLITTTLPNGVVSVNTYDAAGRIVHLTHTGDMQIDYAYQLDGLGNRTVTTETTWSAPELVVLNPGFENGTTGWTEDKWVSSFPATGFLHGTEATAAPHNGSYGYAISNLAWGGLLSDLIPVTPTVTYDLQVWIRGAMDADISLDSDFTLLIRYYSAAGTYLNTDIVVDSGSVTTVWQQEGGQFTIPADVGNVQIGLYDMYGSGWVAFDDISLTKVGNGTNLVTNPGFENGLTGWTKHKSANFPNTTLLLNAGGTATPHSGSYGYSISNHPWGRILSDLIPVTPGATYDFQAWVRGQMDADTTFGHEFDLVVLYYTADGVSLNIATIIDSGSITPIWQQEGRQFTVPANAGKVQLGLYNMYGSGWVAFDDVSLTEVGGGGTNLVTNPGFENGTTGWTTSSAGFPGTGFFRGSSMTATPHSGSYGYAISNHPWGRILSDLIPVVPNATYDLRAWVRGKMNADTSLGNNFDLLAIYYTAAGEPLNIYHFVDSGDVTTTWQQEGGQFTIPANVGKVQIGLYDMYGSGWVAFDDVSLTPIMTTTVISYTYDPLYRLTTATYTGDVNADYSYTYDEVGNMTAYTEQVTSTLTSVERTFNAANQLQTSLDGTKTTQYIYDYNGNLLRILTATEPWDTGYSYTYNQRNLLTSMSELGSIDTTLITYVYNGDGDRAQQVDYAKGITITYTNDTLGMTQVLLADNGSTTTAMLYGLDLIAQDDGTQVRILLADGLGSVRVEMVDSAIETSSTYEPYGKLLVQTGPNGTVYGFTGEQEDSVTGLVYLRARYYSPSLKVFMSRDPFSGSPTLPASQHGYSYAHNNSPNYTDPSGNCIFAGIDTAVCLGAGIGFVGSYSSQVASNVHNGMSFFDAVYYKNINWNQVGAATVAGGVAGATGFMAGGAVSGLVGGMLTPATTTLGAIGNGVVIGAASGFVDGAVAGGAYQLAYNALTPCTDWDENVLLAIGGGAVSGGIIGGAVGGVAGGWRFYSSRYHPVYSWKSEVHAYDHGHAPNSPLIQGKSRFYPGEGGQMFADEVTNHPQVVVNPQGNGRIQFSVDDLGRYVGTNKTGLPTRGGVVVIEGSSGQNPSVYFPGEVVTQYPH